MRTFQGSTEIPNPSAPGLALRASAPPPLEVKDLVGPPGAWKEWWMGQTWDTMQPTKIAKFWSCQPSQNIPKYKLVVNNPEPIWSFLSFRAIHSSGCPSEKNGWDGWLTLNLLDSTESCWGNSNFIINKGGLFIAMFDFLAGNFRVYRG